MNYNGRRIKIGVGIHDSSSALLPYIKSQKQPFVLVSTGTWSVSLNPFAKGVLSPEDQQAKCINYMRIDGKPVKAARLFLGEEYKRQTHYLADHYGVGKDHHKTVSFDLGTYKQITTDFTRQFHFETIAGKGPLATTIPEGTTYEYAYHQLMVELTELQAENIKAALREQPVTKLFIDGGFSDNDVYLKLLAHHFRELKLRTTDSSLGSALGAAICISDRELNSRFLEENYGLKKHQPFILAGGEPAG